MKRSRLRPGKGISSGPQCPAYKHGRAHTKRTAIGPKTYLEARDRLRAKRGQKPARFGFKRGKSKLRAGNKPLRAKPDRKLAAWGREVRERDGNRCQWPGISLERLFDLGCKSFNPRLALYPCATGDTTIDPHHIAERSLRPDLKYELDNGIALCRTHHDWLPLNREAAIALKLLSDETYEAAQKLARAA